MKHCRFTSSVSLAFPAIPHFPVQPFAPINSNIQVMDASAGSQPTLTGGVDAPVNTER